ncbi:Mg2+ transport protein [Williamsoniiplasma somnilux]|uniref:Magnesium transporter MgtE n=1 Tax=Williamsoniiplasma somnilux TaxID=215578 RepID=A0A2K8NZP3_9MOLU|nr:magnesium transporter [Williamsoniiplasma somnilux]ATZ19016.1 Mg2+ transport protein [Williamsoniiplasma somnilux]
MVDLNELKIKLITLAETNDLKGTRKMVEENQPIDFAEILSELEPKMIVRIFRMLDSEEAAEIFTYLKPEFQEIIISAFSSGEIKEIVDELYSDDLIDVIDEMPAEIVKKILKSTTPEQRAELNSILKYEEETAGGIMTVNFIEIKQTWTVEEAIENIRKVHEDFETVDVLYVVDDFGVVKGWLEFKELVFNSSKAKIDKIMNPNVVTVSIDTDQEKVGQIIKRYDLNTIPVIDKKNKMVGIITVDDVLDVIEKETTEDIAKFAGIQKIEDEYFETGIFKMIRSRSIWLLAMLLLGTIGQILIIIFFNIYGINESTMDPKAFYGIMMLSPLVIVLAAIIGISGNQSATMMVRSLALHEIKREDIGKILLKEFLVSLLIALILVLINILRLIIVYSIQFEGLNHSSIWSAIGSSSVAIILTIIFANLIGCLLPIAAKKIKLDPAIVASPLVTTVLDILTIGVFFGIGLALY